MDPATLNIDPRKVEAKITSRTKAIVPVHFAGRACDMDALIAIAQRYGLRPAPFYLGIGYAVLGLGLSALPVRDTRQHVGREISQHHGSSETLVFWEVFRRASFGDRDLFAASQAGLVNNLNFGMSWGILPEIHSQFTAKRAERFRRAPTALLFGRWAPQVSGTPD